MGLDLSDSLEWRIMVDTIGETKHGAFLFVCLDFLMGEFSFAMPNEINAGLAPEILEMTKIIDGGAPPGTTTTCLTALERYTRAHKTAPYISQKRGESGHDRQRRLNFFRRPQAMADA